MAFPKPKNTFQVQLPNVAVLVSKTMLTQTSSAVEHIWVAPTPGADARRAGLGGQQGAAWSWLCPTGAHVPAQARSSSQD